MVEFRHPTVVSSGTGSLPTAPASTLRIDVDDRIQRHTFSRLKKPWNARLAIKRPFVRTLAADVQIAGWVISRLLLLNSGPPLGYSRGGLRTFMRFD